MAIGSSSGGISAQPHSVRSSGLWYDFAMLIRWLVFREASKPMKAMIAHEKALDWQELFELAVRENLTHDELSSMAYRVAGTGLNHKPG